MTKDRSAKDIAKKINEVLIDEHMLPLNKIFGLVCDGTVVNTGRLNGTNLIIQLRIVYKES